MNKLNLILLMILLMTSIVTGCDGRPQASSISSGGQQGEGNTKKIKLEFWALSDQGLKSIVADYEAVNPNVEIQLTEREIDPHKEALRVAAVSGSLPDMWFNWGGSLGSYFPQSGLTLDLTEYAKQHNWANKYIQSSLDLATLDGQLTGVPVHLYGLGVFYRKDIFEKYGITIPTTFQEFEDAMEKLKDNGVTPISTGGKGGWHPMRLVESILEHVAGPKEHDKLMTMEDSWNNEAVIKTYQKWKEWNDKGYLPSRFLMLDPNEAKVPLYQGQAAMILEVPWFDRTLSTDQQNPNLYGFFPFPTDQNPTRVSGYVEMIQMNKHSSKEKQAAALKFAEFLTSKKEIQKHVNLLGAPQALIDAPVSDKMPHIPQIVEALKNGVYQITDQALPQELVPSFFKAQDSVITGEMTPETAATFIQDEIEKYKANVK